MKAFAVINPILEAIKYFYLKANNTCIRQKIDNIIRNREVTAEQAEAALTFGMERAVEFARRGYRLLATGEMGVGNTTTSAAMAAALLGRSPREVTGRGSGLSDESLRRKIEVVEQAA